MVYVGSPQTPFLQVSGLQQSLSDRHAPQDPSTQAVPPVHVPQCLQVPGGGCGCGQVSPACWMAVS